MKKTKKILTSLFIIALILLYAVIYAVPGVTGALTGTDILQYGNFKITDQVTCYFVRDEKVYAAARSGMVNYYVGDGVQVKTGTKILEISSIIPEGTNGESKYKDITTRLGNDGEKLLNCVNEFNGITSYYIDGYENLFTPETMRDLKYERVSRLNPVPGPVNVVRESTLKDEPLYKICKNGKWYIICWVEAGNVSKYKLDRSVTINLPLGQIKATITEIIEDGDKWLIIFTTNRYYEDFAKVRMAPATVVTSDYNGIIIKNESITTSDGAIGVYIKSKSGSYIFKPIKIMTSDGHYSLAEVSYFIDKQGSKVNTVEIYDEILINPSRY